MNEFEKELENKVSPHDRTHNDNELFLGGVLAEHFKDWQPPKPQEIPVEVPQRFADWFEEKMAASFLSVVSAYSFSDDEDIKWIRDNGGLDLLCKMKLYGYTVEKEKMYEVVFYVDEEDDRCLLMKTDKTILFEYESQNEGRYKQQFTEAEIKAIENLRCQLRRNKNE